MTRRRLALSWLRALAVAAQLLSLPAGATPRSDTLRYGITVVPPTFGNPYGGNGTPGTFYWYALFDALTRLDASGTPASEEEALDDGQFLGSPISLRQTTPE